MHGATVHVMDYSYERQSCHKRKFVEWASDTELAIPKS